MPRAEHTLVQSKRTLPRRPFSVDTPVPQPVPDAQGTTPHPTPHRGTVASRPHSVVSLITVHHLTRSGEVHPAVVNRGGGGLQVPDDVPALEDEELHHHPRVDVGSAYFLRLVVVEVSDDGGEGFVFEGLILG